jgi:hypothetical protein
MRMSHDDEHAGADLFDEDGNLKRPRLLADDYFQKPSQARVWNYLQGGKENYPLDREVGDAMAAAYPDMFYHARQCREFVLRASGFVASCGVRQYLDIGCGLPVGNGLRDLHEVVQETDPSARVVYVDNDPVVFVHAQALMTSRVQGAGPIDYLEADVRDCDLILDHAARTLDFDQPVGILLCGVLGALPYDVALAVVERLLAAVPAGSYLVWNDGSDTSAEAREAATRERETETASYHLRTADEVSRFFEGLELVEPGIVSVTLWRPDPVDVGAPRPVDQFGAVAVKR